MLELFFCASDCRGFPKLLLKLSSLILHFLRQLLVLLPALIGHCPLLALLPLLPPQIDLLNDGFGELKTFVVGVLDLEHVFVEPHFDFLQNIYSGLGLEPRTIHARALTTDSVNARDLLPDIFHQEINVHVHLIHDTATLVLVTMELLCGTSASRSIL